MYGFEAECIEEVAQRYTVYEVLLNGGTFSVDVTPKRVILRDDLQGTIHPVALTPAFIRVSVRGEEVKLLWRIPFWGQALTGRMLSWDHASQCKMHIYPR